MKNLVRNRDFADKPSFWYTNDLEWDPDKHAGFYVMENKLGSTGGQVEAMKLGLFGCVVETHKGYSKRSEFGTYFVEWGCVDISKISQAGNRKNKQFDKDIHDMIISIDPRVKIDPANDDALIIKTGHEEYRPLTPAEIFQYLDQLFSKDFNKKVYPPHTRQLEIIKSRRDFLLDNRDKDLILNVESLHTRFGKDKTNYLGIQPETEMVVVFSGYFATFQIVTELDPGNDQAVETRARSKEAISNDIVSARKNGKRVWLLISTYNDEDSDRIELLSLFKNVNVEIVIDEVDYQAWGQINLIRKALEYVIG